MGRRLAARSNGFARDTTFLIGGWLVIGLGVALAVGLAWAGAGWLYFQAWLGALVAVGLGAFFISVGRGERQERRRVLREYEAGAPPPAPPRP
jgi:cobalamin biosynthesis protein CobD/CbiB